MGIEQYSSVFSPDYLMGPNSMVLLDEMIAPYAGRLSGARILDLGCGQGVSSLYLAKETGAGSIISTDLWIDATRLEQNFEAWGIADRAFPVHADANALPFGAGCFDAVVSVDAYHYFGLQPGFFAEKIWPLVRPGGGVYLCMPGLKHEFGGEYPELMREWAGDEANCFHSAQWWKETLLSGTEGVCEAITAESKCFDRAWDDWFTSGHPYALRDKEFIERGLGEYLAFVCVTLQKAK